ncbi:putative reverse transcriptase domain-containing protein [Tanacetum coccineum]
MSPKRTTTPITNAAIKALIAQGVATALAEYEANRDSGNGDDSLDSGSGRRPERATHECDYSDFLKCQPLNFKGTKGVVGLTQWFEKMESVFHISNCNVVCQVKFATCTLLGNALMWKMFPEESDEVEKYVGGLLDMIQGSVMASKPKTMQDAIEFATELMDQKIRTFANHQAENKKKLNDNSRNNRNQQQPFKRQNVARAYTVGPGEKKEYEASLPLCPNATTITMGSVLPSTTTARKLAIWSVAVGAGNGGAQARAYAGKNPDANVITSTFLLNSRYTSILFDTGADRIFVSTAFTSLIDIVPTDEKIVRYSFGNEILIVHDVEKQKQGYEFDLTSSHVPNSKVSVERMSCLLAHVTNNEG